MDGADPVAGPADAGPTSGAVPVAGPADAGPTSGADPVAGPAVSGPTSGADGADPAEGATDRTDPAGPADPAAGTAVAGPTSGADAADPAGPAHPSSSRSRSTAAPPEWPWSQRAWERIARGKFKKRGQGRSR